MSIILNGFEIDVLAGYAAEFVPAYTELNPKPAECVLPLAEYIPIRSLPAVDMDASCVTRFAEVPIPQPVVAAVCIPAYTADILFTECPGGSSVITSQSFSVNPGTPNPDGEICDYTIYGRVELCVPCVPQLDCNVTNNDGSSYISLTETMDPCNYHITGNISNARDGVDGQDGSDGSDGYGYGMESCVTWTSINVLQSSGWSTKQVLASKICGSDHCPCRPIVVTDRIGEKCCICIDETLPGNLCSLYSPNTCSDSCWA